jgi:hypothetical protein
VAQWETTKWVDSAPFAPLAKSNRLNGVVAPSPTNVWAVGSIFYGSNTPLIVHFDGTQWTAPAAPSPGASGFLADITTVPGAQTLWAVGQGPTYPYIIRKN